MHSHSLQLKNFLFQKTEIFAGRTTEIIERKLILQYQCLLLQKFDILIGGNVCGFDRKEEILVNLHQTRG